MRRSGGSSATSPWYGDEHRLGAARGAAGQEFEDAAAGGFASGIRGTRGHGGEGRRRSAGTQSRSRLAGTVVASGGSGRSQYHGMDWYSVNIFDDSNGVSGHSATSDERDGEAKNLRRSPLCKGLPRYRLGSALRPPIQEAVQKSRPVVFRGGSGRLRCAKFHRGGKRRSECGLKLGFRAVTAAIP